MAFRETLMQFIGKLVFENPGKNAGPENLRTRLQQNTEAVLARMKSAANTQANISKANHIITIERWGQNRLRVALNEKEFVQDNSKDYAPSQNLGLAELIDLFTQTRAETIVLAAKVIRSEKTVPHNQMGALSSMGWLRYLTMHAGMESQRLK